jgi:hypothetical protein
MQTQLYGAFPTHLQQIFAAFCLLLAESCIFLFFLMLAPKSCLLLIMNTAATSKNQTEIKGNLIQMSLYGHLTTSHPRQKTNFPKQFSAPLI